MSNISGTFNNIGENISSGVSNIGTAASNTFGSVKESLNDFSSTNYINAGSEFLQSNSIIAKFVFILLVVIVFVFLFNLGIYLISLITQGNRNPFLIKGMLNGNQFKHITQDPRLPDSITIYRSNDRPTGIEFSWSVWLNISDPGKDGLFRHIFNMGNGEYGADGIATVNNAPGLYVGSKNNFGFLHVIMDTVNNTGFDKQSMDVTNIPLGKWFHTLIRIENNVLDVYINGVITSRLNLLHVPRLNYNDVYVCANNGFAGSLSNLQYYDHALNVFEINRIVSSGPNLSAYGSHNKPQSQYYYLSSSWYNSKLNQL